ncbi:MAG: OmpA family protein [Burkholderiaceae bacterium]|nr:OmpA family protein [Burkholderiaceae bacterium]
MKNSLIRKKLALAISCALALGFGSGAASAQEDPMRLGYVQDPRGSIVTSGSGLCWQTGAGPSAQSTLECDPNYVMKPLARVEQPMPPVAAAAPTPAPIAAPTPAPTPAPQPIALVQPAPEVVRQRVSFDADALFDFDKSFLRPAGQVALDEFVGKLHDIESQTITTVGHADRLGSIGYNQRLSEERVAAVKAYLVGKGVDPGRIHTEGMGESQPVTKSGECVGPKSARLIACLQPDRRVDIEVVGSRVVR